MEDERAAGAWARRVGFVLGALGVASGCGDPASASEAPTSEVDSSRHDRSPRASSRIEHVIVVVQENHSFDNYFGRYCTAAPGSEPTCTSGARCCEAGPELDPAGHAPVVLDDASNVGYDPAHYRACELAEMNGGAMDLFTTQGAGGIEGCGDPSNFAYATDAAAPYWELARHGALADRYFQPIVGASSANDMYLAAARAVFDDNDWVPEAVGRACAGVSSGVTIEKKNLGEVLNDQNVSWRFYGEGYQAMLGAESLDTCPGIPDECPAQVNGYPCNYDPADDPFSYFTSTVDDPDHIVDFGQLAIDLDARRLPRVSFVKALGYKTEHPESTISAGTDFVTGVVDAVSSSSSADSTLILITWDEGGGYFDHVAPPPTSEVDQQPYGPRIPLIAVGPFARVDTVSHVTMEHASIVKFIEWNFLDHQTGQLGARDAEVNGIGSLIDPKAAGIAIP